METLRTQRIAQLHAAGASHDMDGESVIAYIKTVQIERASLMYWRWRLNAQPTTCVPNVTLSTGMLLADALKMRFPDTEGTHAITRCASVRLLSTCCIPRTSAFLAIFSVVRSPSPPLSVSMNVDFRRTRTAHH
jgi:hypothetical protein